MHRIRKSDIAILQKYNLKRNSNQLFRLVLPDPLYYRTWVSGHQVWLRKGKTDILVFKKIFIDREYDFAINGDVSYIIDAGANVGLSSLFFALKYPKAIILAIEPEGSNFELLKKNTHGIHNIIPVLGGVSNHTGKFMIKNNQGDHWNFMLADAGEGDQADGKLYSVQDLMEVHSFPRIDFFKIDIEGGEAELFNKHNEWLSKVQWMSIELHDFILPNSSNSFINALSSHDPFNFAVHGENILIHFNNHS
jgi:FkbM family methyltransferase